MPDTTKASPGKLRSPLKWHGGKSYLARRINALARLTATYVEPFAGGANVLLNRPRSLVEILGDRDAELMGFYRVLRDQSYALRETLKGWTYTEESFVRAREVRPANDLESAAAFLVRNRMSRGGLGRSFAWSDRLRGGQPGDRNAWETTLANLPRVAERLRGVELVTGPAVATIRRHDTPGTLHYCDPPYLPATRTVRNAYAHEMTIDQHVELLDTLRACQGAVLLSGYPSDLYDRALAGWERHEFDMPNHSGQGKSKQRRTEVLWIKPATI